MAEEIGSSGVMPKSHRKVLRENRTELENNLQAVQLLSYMHEILTDEDMEDVKAEKTTFARARVLLDIIPKKGDKALAVFISALSKVQPHLAEMLKRESGIQDTEDTPSCDKNNEHVMSQDCRKRLKCCREHLNDINMAQVLTLIEIVLNQSDIQSIMSKPTRDEQLDEFISVLGKKDPKAFNHFVTILENMGNHNEAVQCLKGKPSEGPVPSYPKDLPKPIQVVTLDEPHKVKDVLVISIFHKLGTFFELTNENDYWKSLVEEFQLQQGHYESSSNPTREVIKDWSIKEGDNATTKALSDALSKQSLLQCKQCFERIESEVPYLPNVNDLSKGIEKLGVAHTDGCPAIIHDLKEHLIHKLHETVVIEARSHEDCLNIVSDLSKFKNYKICDLTKLLREHKLTGSIEWMKRNLPAGATGPRLDENTYIRDIPYRVRCPLTMELTADKNWIPLAERLGLQPTKIRYIEQQFTNCADEVLKDWQTKRDSTVGTLYDILVELEMPVIADKTL